MRTPVSDRLLRLLFRSLIFGGVLFLSTLPAVSHAQITLDGSLGPKGPLTGPDYTIDAKVGQLRGNNLFHSFGQFNVHTGHTDDLEHRMDEHHSGAFGGYTATRKPVELVFAQECATREEVLRTERQLKG